MLTLHLNLLHLDFRLGLAERQTLTVLQPDEKMRWSRPVNTLDLGVHNSFAVTNWTDSPGANVLLFSLLEIYFPGVAQLEIHDGGSTEPKLLAVVLKLKGVSIRHHRVLVRSIMEFDVGFVVPTVLDEQELDSIHTADDTRCLVRRHVAHAN